eukprot:scaffold18718_cov45-Attheya_sp.AAC.8
MGVARELESGSGSLLTGGSAGASFEILMMSAALHVSLSAASLIIGSSEVALATLLGRNGCSAVSLFVGHDCVAVLVDPDRETAVVALHIILGFFFVVVGLEARLGDTGYGYTSRGGENVFQLSCPGIGRRWLAERRVWGVGGFRRVVSGGSGLNLVGGPAGAVGNVSAMVWFEVGIGFHRRKR